MLRNVFPSSELRGLAVRRRRPLEFKSVRNALVTEEVEKGWEIAKKNRTTTRLRREKSHDKALEDRVWSLFYRFGFAALSGNGGSQVVSRAGSEQESANQIDVVAIDNEVALGIECKSKKQAGRFGDFSGDLAKLVASREQFTRAVKEQFPVVHKRPTVFCIWTANHIVSEPDRIRAAAERVILLDETDLSYFEALAAQVGLAARYQFLSSLLAERPVPGLEIVVPAIRSKMGLSTAYTFSIAPEYLLKIAFVSHRAKGKASDIDAYQRMLKRSRLRNIRQYISDGGIFPTNIVVNVSDSKWLTFERGKQESEGADSTFGWLRLKPSYRVAWIIDGQHRLFAYAGHPLANKTLVSVLAFVGLPASEQARLFVDINAEQRKVKQSLLQELFAELHWDADSPEIRVQAILSKAVQAIDRELDSPLRNRILKADDQRTDVRCISLTSVFKALEKTQFYIVRRRKGGVVEFGPLWSPRGNEETLRRTVRVLKSYFDSIRVEAGQVWELGAAEGGGLAMNDGITVCINVLRSIILHLEKKRMDLGDLDDNELSAALRPWALRVGKYFSGLSAEQMRDFRALRGVQGQTAGTRRIEQAFRQEDSTFDPPGLAEFLDREKAETTKRAFEILGRIEVLLQRTVLAELRSEYGTAGDEWWFAGVPKAVRKKIDDRINEEGGKRGGREANFDLIDYREVIGHNWQTFEEIFGRGKGSKDARTKWIVDVNELRKIVMHASKGLSIPISEEQLGLLAEIQRWLEERVASAA